jgi:hypothetical protein
VHRIGGFQIRGFLEGQYGMSTSFIGQLRTMKHVHSSSRWDLTRSVMIALCWSRPLTATSYSDSVLCEYCMNTCVYVATTTIVLFSVRKKWNCLVFSPKTGRRTAHKCTKKKQERSKRTSTNHLTVTAENTFYEIQSPAKKLKHDLTREAHTFRAKCHSTPRSQPCTITWSPP